MWAAFSLPSQPHNIPGGGRNDDEVAGYESVGLLAARRDCVTACDDRAVSVHALGISTRRGVVSTAGSGTGLSAVTRSTQSSKASTRAKRASRALRASGVFTSVSSRSDAPTDAKPRRSRTSSSSAACHTPAPLLSGASCADSTCSSRGVIASTPSMTASGVPPSAYFMYTCTRSATSARASLRRVLLCMCAAATSAASTDTPFCPPLNDEQCSGSTRLSGHLPLRAMSPSVSSSMGRNSFSPLSNWLEKIHIWFVE